MISAFVAELGPWSWMVLGGILLAAEIVVPGFFLLWIGIAAVLTGALSLQLWDWSPWTWQLQVLAFLFLSLCSAFAGKKILGAGAEPLTDEPLLNRRAEQLVGRTATLIEPLAQGVGRISIGDTVWRVKGPDLPSGTRVRVVSAHGVELEVAAE
jgi:membrane protein implicated in regulation of membrane protease activity